MVTLCPSVYNPLRGSWDPLAIASSPPQKRNKKSAYMDNLDVYEHLDNTHSSPTPRNCLFEKFFDLWVSPSF